MAILGPSDLPVVLRIPSDPIKSYVITRLGHPVTEVEITEDQFEIVLRTAGDFIAHYFPREQRLAWFWTNALQSTYDMPADAYWVQACNWDPATTRIDDVFGAESFLFCFGDGLQALGGDGGLVDPREAKMLATPVGRRPPKMRRYSKPQPLIKVCYGDGELVCTPNHPLKQFGGGLLHGWIPAVDTRGVELQTRDGKSKVDKIIELPAAPTVAVRTAAHCFYGCHAGKPVLVH